MKNQQKIIGSLAVLCAVASAGCNVQAFNQMNDSLKAVATTSKTVGNGRMATAVLATAIGGVSIVQSLSAKNSAGVIAAGAGNYSLTQWSEDILGKPLTTPLSGNENVKGDVKYTSKIEGGKLVSELTVEGAEASGYTMDAQGTFKYSQENIADAELTATLTRKSATGDVTLTVNRLAFTIPNPMPANTNEFGVLDIAYKEGSDSKTLNISLSRKNSKIEGLAKVDGKDYTFSEDNPNFTEKQ